MRSMTLWSALLVIGFAAVAEAQRFERILFPLVVLRHPGAYGTVWTSKATVWHSGSAPVELFPSECYFRCSGGCAITTCNPGAATPPQSYYAPNDLDRGELGATPNPATLLYVPRDRSSDVAASLHLLEETYRTVEAGVELPVVREAGLFTTLLTLPSVPVLPPGEGRTHLRLYGVESPSGRARVNVRMYPVQTPTTVTYDVTVDLLPPRYSGATPRPNEFDEPQPSYLQLLVPPEAARTSGAVRIVVESRTETLKFWAMASVTTNTTQHVTIVSPQ